MSLTLFERLEIGIVTAVVAGGYLLTIAWAIRHLI